MDVKLDRWRAGSPELRAALWYAGEREWPVAPGTYVERAPALPICSCRQPDCQAPGEHPADEWWHYLATTRPQTIRWWWTTHPGAAVVLPTGREFDVLEVSANAGHLALVRFRREGRRLGPVAFTARGRCQFYAAADAAEALPALLEELGWPQGALDVRALGDGQYVLAPVFAARSGTRARWARPPTATPGPLPEARHLVATLAHASRLVGEPRAPVPLAGAGWFTHTQVAG